MTQKELAQRLGYSPRHINQVLRGRTAPSVKLAKKLGQILNVSWTTWFEGKSETDKQSHS